jgi:hypothetical protein
MVYKILPVSFIQVVRGTTGVIEGKKYIHETKLMRNA